MRTFCTLHEVHVARMVVDTNTLLSLKITSHNMRGVQNGKEKGTVDDRQVMLWHKKKTLGTHRNKNNKRLRDTK